jgi:hypothetical protein
MFYRATVDIHGLHLDRGEGEPPILGLFCTVLVTCLTASQVDAAIHAEAEAFWLRHPFSRLPNRSRSMSFRIDTKRKTGPLNYLHDRFLSRVSRGCSYYVRP